MKKSKAEEIRSGLVKIDDVNYSNIEGKKNNFVYKVK